MLLDAVKVARGIKTDAYDDDFRRLIREGFADLKRLGIPAGRLNEADAMVSRAVITYCCMSFRRPPNYDQLKASYDEQRAQLLTTTGYGLRGGDDDDPGRCD